MSGNLKKAFPLPDLFGRLGLGGLAGYAIGAFAWDGLAPWFFQYVPGFTEEKFARIQEWYAEWAGLSLSRWLFPHSLQDFYHCQRSTGHGSRPLSSCLSR